MNAEQQLNDMTKLAHGITMVLCSRHQDLEDNVKKTAEQETRLLSEKDFDTKLSECKDYQKDIEVFIRALGPLDTDTEKKLELLKLQVCCTHC